MRHDVEVSGDDGRADLLAEIEHYPTVHSLPATSTYRTTWSFRELVAT